MADSQSDPVAAGDSALHDQTVHAISQRIFETSLDLILVVDRHGTFVRVSPSSHAILGYHPDELAGRDTKEILYDQDLDITREEMRRARRGEPMRHFECRYVHRSGRIVEITWTGIWSDPEQQYFFIGRDVTERKAMEQRLRQSEGRFLDIAEVSGDWIWETDRDHRFTVLYGGSTDTLPIRPESVLGLTRWETANASPESDAEWARHKADLDAHRPFRHFRYTIALGDWVCLIISASGKPVFGETGEFVGYRGTATDVTSIVEAQRRAEQAEALLWDAIESISEGFAIYDDQDRLFICNAGYRALLQESADRIVPGVRYEDIIRSGLQQGYYADAVGHEEEWLAEQLRQHHDSTGGNEIRLRDGRWLLVTQRPMTNGWVASLRVNITALKAAHQHLQETNQRLLEAREAQNAAVNANQAKSRFLATASHDLRQPLHAMNLFISALRRRVVGDEATRLVAGMAAATESMQAMFNSLLDVSKLEAGAITPNFTDFALEEVLARLRASFAGPASAKGLKLGIAPSAARVYSDPVLLESILRNLLSNAVRYTRQGQVSLRCKARGAVVRIEVTDTGPGIPAHERERIFEEFERLDSPDVSERGLGLGLAIVRRLAELLEIGVELRSELGKGSVFSLAAARAAATFVATDMPVNRSSPLAGRRVLLVEDDALVRDAVTCEVADWGALPIVACNAEEALALLAQPGQPQPEIAIVDRDLGGALDGPALLDLLRERLHLMIPAMIVTGATDPDALAALRRSGYPWITKPIDAEVLHRTASELLAAAALPSPA